MSDKLEQLIENFFAKKENYFTIEKLKEEIAVQYLQEKQGVMRYKEGDKFVAKDQPTIEYTAKQVVLLPNDGRKKFDTKEECSAAIKEFADKNKLQLHEINREATAAIVVVLSDLKNKLHAYVRYFRELKPLGHDMWLTPTFISDTGLEQAVAGDKITASQSERLEIKPMNLVGDNTPRKATELQTHCLSNMEKLKLDNMVKGHIKDLFKAAINNEESPVLVGGAKYAKTYNKYLGEILAPISLLSGWICEGQREESQILINSSEKIVTKYSLDMSISFNTNVSEELIDSYVHDRKGFSVQISSKAGSGAAASLSRSSKILEDTKNKSVVVNGKKITQYENFSKNYPYVKEILEITRNKDINSYQAPIQLASKLGLINSEEMSLLNDILVDKKISIKDFNTKYLKLILQSPLLNKAWNRLTPRNKDAYIPVIRIISGLAKVCADQINEDDEKYKFDEAMKLLLSFGMIQMNSYITNVGKNDCKFTEFIVKYPPVFNGKILLDAEKSYTSTSITGQFGFKIP
jgi:hypothetical protein